MGYGETFTVKRSVVYSFAVFASRACRAALLEP